MRGDDGDVDVGVGMGQGGNERKGRGFSRARGFEKVVFVDDGLLLTRVFLLFFFFT